MKQGLDGMLLEASSDDDVMTPLSSPLQSARRSAQRDNSQEILCPDLMSTTDDISTPELSNAREDQNQKTTDISSKLFEEEDDSGNILNEEEEEEEEEEKEKEEMEDEEQGDEASKKRNGNTEKERRGNETDKEDEKGKEQLPRFFVMKSFSQYDIDVSMERNIWATQPHNERKLNDAFDNGSVVILFFSVNASGRFQGCAKMTSKIGEEKMKEVWKQIPNKKNQKDNNDGRWGGTFSLEWISKNYVDFIATSHILNPLNEGKPVKVGRDGQEMTFSAGIALLNMFISPAEIERSIPPLRGYFTSLSRRARRNKTDQEKKRSTKQQRYHQHNQAYNSNSRTQPQLYKRKANFSPGRGNNYRCRGSFRRPISGGNKFRQLQPPMGTAPQRPPAAFIPIQGQHQGGEVYIRPVPFIPQPPPAAPPSMYTGFYPFGQAENPFPEYYNLYRSFIVPQPAPPLPKGSGGNGK